MGEWTFQTEDFLTPAPYEALYAYHKQPFVHAAKMAELAAYQYIRDHEPKTYQAVVGVDHLLRDKNPKPPMNSDLFISRSRKRIEDLTPEDCNDAECFEYCGHQVWNGF